LFRFNNIEYILVISNRKMYENKNIIEICVGAM